MYQPTNNMNAKEFYDHIVKHMTPEAALLKLLEGAARNYESLKFADEDTPVHPLLIIIGAAAEMGWDLHIRKDEDPDAQVDSVIIGTEEGVKKLKAEFLREVM